MAALMSALMSAPIELRSVPLQDLRNRLDLLEDEAELVRLLIRRRLKQERDQRLVDSTFGNESTGEVCV